MTKHWVCLALGLAVVESVGCGATSEAEPQPSVDRLTIERQAGGALSGRYQALELQARRLGPLSANVELRIESLLFDAHFDYGAGEVVLDGHGMELDRTSHQLLLQAISRWVEEFGPDAAGLPVEELALYASLVSWQQSGGVAVQRTTFPLARAEGSGRATLNKSFQDDGTGCIKKGATYNASFDYSDTVVVDRLVAADSHSWNGLCGPACVQLTPFRMWTLDCLEHDECCSDIDADAPSCWVPLGECGDEYEHATADFLQGFSPFGRRCGG